MKRIDVTKSVMHSVALFEEERITSWRRKFLVACLVLAAVFFGTLILIGIVLAEQQTFDLLSLFTEDREIVAEFWQDTVMTFFAELPRPEIYIACAVVAIGAILLVMTSGIRRIAAKKEREIKKYHSSVRGGSV